LRPSGASLGPRDDAADVDDGDGDGDGDGDEMPLMTLPRDISSAAPDRSAGEGACCRGGAAPVTLPAADGGSLRGSRFIRANDGVACSSPMARRSGATRDGRSIERRACSIGERIRRVDERRPRALAAARSSDDALALARRALTTPLPT